VSEFYNMPFFDLTYSVTNAKIKRFATLYIFMVMQIKLVVVSNEQPR